MIRYLYTQESDHHSKSSYRHSPYNSFPGDENFQDLPCWQLSNTHYNNTDYGHHAVHYTPGNGILAMN